MEARVPMRSLSSNPNFEEESPGGMSETRIPTSTTMKPRPPASHIPKELPGTLDDSGEHVEEGNEVEDDGRVDEHLVGAAGSVVDLGDEEDGAGDCALDEDRNPRGFPARVNFSEGGGEITVDPDDEGDARNACDRGADSAGIADGDEQGGEDAEESDFERYGADGDGVEDAALWVEI